MYNWCYRSDSCSCDSYTYAVNNFTANGFENQVTLSVSPGSISGDSPLDYSFTVSATPNSNYEISNLSISGLNGQATVSGTVA